MRIRLALAIVALTAGLAAACNCTPWEFFSGNPNVREGGWCQNWTYAGFTAGRQCGACGNDGRWVYQNYTNLAGNRVHPGIQQWYCNVSPTGLCVMWSLFDQCIADYTLNVKCFHPNFQYDGRCDWAWGQWTKGPS